MSSAQDQGDGGSGGGDTVSSAVMLAVVLVLFLAVVLIFFFYLYAKRRMGRSPSFRGHYPARFIFSPEHVAPHPGRGRGLDAAVLRSLPVTIYRAADYKEGIECAVCLTELADGDESRLLPKCSHRFHVACIDAWFRSHATCPICRAPVGSQPTGDQGTDGAGELARASPTSEAAAESLGLPSGVLLPRQGPSSYAGSSGAKTAAGGALVIEIQSRAPEGIPSPLPPSRPAKEEAKSPALSRLRSLTRRLSLGKRAAGPSDSPRGADIEQGYGESALTPKALNHP